MFYFSLDVLRRMRIHGYFPSYVTHSYICLAFIRSFVYLVYGERLYNETSKTQPLNLSLFLYKTKRSCCSFGFLTSQLLASVVSCTFLFSCCLWFELILTHTFFLVTHFSPWQDLLNLFNFNKLVFFDFFFD